MVVMMVKEHGVTKKLTLEFDQQVPIERGGKCLSNISKAFDIPDEIGVKPYFI